MKTKQVTYRPRIRSRHDTHSPLRTELPKMPFRSVIRLGSTTEVNDVDVELNSIEGVKNSSDKLLMKRCFDEANVSTAKWVDDIEEIEELEFPIIIKHRLGSRNTGNYKIDTPEQLTAWKKGKTFDSYIFEKFYNYSKEYRLHVNEDGCFYTCRKMLKDGTPDDEKWHRHDSNSVWILETNASFEKPTSWDAIVKDCVKALKALELDFCCFDVKVQSNNDSKGKPREKVEWIIIESGSAPSFGAETTKKYLEMFPKLLTKKYNQ